MEEITMADLWEEHHSKAQDEAVSSMAGSVPGWVREEIKETWKTARQCGSQMEAFRIFERMTDRLGYGRMDNNPSLAAPNSVIDGKDNG